MAGSSNNKTKQNSKKTGSSSGAKRKTTTNSTRKKRISAAERQRLEQQAKMREEIATLLFLHSIFCLLCVISRLQHQMEAKVALLVPLEMF